MIKGAWAGFVALAGISSGNSSLFAFAVNAVLISLAVVWLFSDRLSRVWRPLKWPLAFVLFAMVTGASLPAVGLGIQTMIILVFTVVVWSILLSALPFGAMMSRRKWHPVRFVIWATVWMFAVTLPLFYLFGAIQMSSLPTGSMLMQILMVAAISAAIMTAGLLPFEILWFVSGFWRQRFEKLLLLRTKPAPEPVEQVEAVTKN